MQLCLPPIHKECLYETSTPYPQQGGLENGVSFHEFATTDSGPNGVILTVGYDVPYNCSSPMIRLPPLPKVRVGSRPQLVQKRSRVLRLVPSRNSGEGSGAHVSLDTHARDENPLLA